MKTSKLLISTGLISVITVLSISGAVLAWHPQGTIIKKVQNVTEGSAMSDANSTATAVAAQPGDVLTYSIEVSNKGAAASHHYNDMVKTVMTDKLPTGVELVSNPAQRQITENLGTITPGKSVTKQYSVKVTATTAGTITNKACFTGNSIANDNAQKGCDVAVVTVTIPSIPVTPTPVPPTPTPPVTITTPVTPPTETPPELPHTGVASNLIGSIVAVAAITYGVSLYIRSRKLVRSSLQI